MKKILNILIMYILSLNIMGCMQTQQPIPKEYADIKISNDRVIGYAHMRNGVEFLKITEKQVIKDDDVELIRITKGGFSPNYNLDDEGLCLTNYNKNNFTITKMVSQDIGDNLTSSQILFENPY